MIAKLYGGCLFSSLIAVTVGFVALGTKLTAGDASTTGAGIAEFSSHAHRAAGVVVLLSGLTAFAAPKGRRLHRIAGRLYVGSIIALAVFIMPMLMAAPSGLHVLTMLAVYLTVSGALIAIKRRAAKTDGIDWSSEIKSVLHKACASALLGYCLGALNFGEPGVPETPLALLGLAVAVYDLLLRCGDRSFANPIARICSHALRMSGSFLVLLSANFYAVTTATDTLPLALRWLIPAVGSAATLFAVPYVFGVAPRRSV